MTTVAISAPGLRFDPFHLGIYACAWCEGEVRGEGRISHELPYPLIDSRGARRRWIPAGRQSFHPECFVQLPEDARAGGGA
jgi:hypothetical protein